MYSPNTSYFQNATMNNNLITITGATAGGSGDPDTFHVGIYTILLATVKGGLT